MIWSSPLFLHGSMPGSLPRCDSSLAPTSPGSAIRGIPARGEARHGIRQLERANVASVPRRRRQRERLGALELLRSPLYSRNCQDALRIMERLAVAAMGRPGSVRNLYALSAETGMSVPTITQTVTFLRRAGLVAQRVPSGGISLARPASQVTLYDVVRATDGAGMFRHCLVGLAECSDATPCPVHSFWKQARAVLEQHLEAQSVADLARAMAQKRRARRR